MKFPNSPTFNTRTLEDFKARLRGGGARPNLFECVIDFPQLLNPKLNTEEKSSIKEDTTSKLLVIERLMSGPLQSSTMLISILEPLSRSG